MVLNTGKPSIPKKYTETHLSQSNDCVIYFDFKGDKFEVIESDDDLIEEEEDESSDEEMRTGIYFFKLRNVLDCVYICQVIKIHVNLSLFCAPWYKVDLSFKSVKLNPDVNRRSLQTSNAYSNFM